MILSIQSHVVHGHVGNKCATFPLQLLGWEVDSINTVQFSNHTGYPCFTGYRLEADKFHQILDGLKKNGLLKCYSHLLSGYVGTAESLQVLVELVKELKEESRIIYVLDPVLGDNGQLYVPKELIPIYRDQLLPLADVITPNAFELGTLSGKRLDSMEMALDAIQWLKNKYHIPLIVLTSIEFPSENTHLYLIVSFLENVFYIRFEKINGVFTGSGDLFAALFLGNLPKKDLSQWTLNEIMHCSERALNSMQGVLHETMNAEKDSSLPLAACRELRLVQSRTFIEHPSLLYKATLMNTV